VDYKTNAAVGGGFELTVDAQATATEKVDVYTFDKRTNLKQLVPVLTKDVIIHNRAYFYLCFNQSGDLIKIKHIGAEKIRKDKYGETYFICEDWSSQIDIKEIKPYKWNLRQRECLYVYENKSVGQDVYPLPQYSSAMNWAFLDGEMSYLQKSNIINSIFPSFAMLFPKKPQSEEEKIAIKNTIDKAKGAQNGGKAIAFFANNAESLPKIESIPTNSNDNLFQNTTESIDSKICQAHIIDPILMGIRVSGKLGSGSDIKQAYIIFEKNTIIPLRNIIEDIVNDLLKIADVKADFTINNFQIVNETIVELDENTSAVNDALNTMNPELAKKVIETMTVNEIRAMVGLPAIQETNETPAQ
jgi:capsid portal protein